MLGTRQGDGTTEEPDELDEQDEALVDAALHAFAAGLFKHDHDMGILAVRLTKATQLKLVDRALLNHEPLGAVARRLIEEGLDDDPFPHGKLRPDDEGGIYVSIGVQGEAVVISFGAPTAWLGLGRADLEPFIAVLQKHLQELP